MRERILFIEQLRAIAVLCVVAAHTLYELRHFGLAGDELRKAFNHIPFHYGVDLFFVISGFIMMYTFGEKFGQKGVVRDFMLRRLIRIVPAYWVYTTLFLFALIIVPGVADRAQFDGLHYLTSLLFLPYLSDTQGISPLLSIGWSLNYELYFYIFFAIGLAFMRGLGIAVVVMCCALSFIFAQTLLPFGALQLVFAKDYLFIFLLGMLCFFVHGNKRGTLVLFFIFLAASLLSFYLGINSHALKIGCLAAALFLMYGFFVTNPRESFFTSIGTLSYIIYLSHAFVLETLSRVFLKIFGDSALSAVSYTITVFVAAVMWSSIYHHYADMPMTNWLKKKCIKPQVSAPPLQSPGQPVPHLQPQP
ncbi:MAG: acyltransferase [Alphaproteobacteria bacterium]|jgi:peptidoglycan/LPS O-acetylase OafA/YrhL|nr:acyltransferase [Alphaproteobacteria bacterium]